MKKIVSMLTSAVLAVVTAVSGVMPVCAEDYKNEMEIEPFSSVTADSVELVFGKIDVCRYKVFQKIDGDFVEIYDTGSSDEDFFDGGSYKVTGLRSCTSYTFMVSDVGQGGVPTEYSSPMTFKTKPAQVKVKAVRASRNAVRLSWKKVKCEGYKLQVYDDHNFKWVSMRTVGKDITSARISGLKPGRKYKVRVKAFGRIPKGRKQYVPARSGHTKVLWGKPSKAVVVRTKK